jgi:hypothetical protein
MELNFGRARLDEELVNRRPMVQLSRTLLPRLGDRSQYFTYPGVVHSQQHRVVTEVQLFG